MRCISAAYAVMRCLSVCPSVCLSRSWVVSKRIKISSKFFPPSGSHTILVFPYQTGWRYSDGNLPNGGIECRWGRQKSRFWACLLLTLQQTRWCKHCRRWTTATISQIVTLIIIIIIIFYLPKTEAGYQKRGVDHRWSYTAGIRPPSATRDKVIVSVVLRRESDQARSRTIHNHDRSCV